MDRWSPPVCERPAMAIEVVIAAASNAAAMGIRNLPMPTSLSRPPTVALRARYPRVKPPHPAPDMLMRP